MHMKHFAHAAIVAAAGLVFAIGSAAPSQAAKKKVAAAPAPHSIFCTMDYKPVCAERGGLKQTYANSCFASRDNAKILSNEACGAKKAMHKTHKKKTAMKKSTKKPTKKMSKTDKTKKKL